MYFLIKYWFFDVKNVLEIKFIEKGIYIKEIKLYVV